MVLRPQVGHRRREPIRRRRRRPARRPERCHRGRGTHRCVGVCPDRTKLRTRGRGDKHAEAPGGLVTLAVNPPTRRSLHACRCGCRPNHPRGRQSSPALNRRITAALERLAPLPNPDRPATSAVPTTTSPAPGSGTRRPPDATVGQPTCSPSTPESERTHRLPRGTLTQDRGRARSSGFRPVAVMLRQVCHTLLLCLARFD